MSIYPSLSSSLRLSCFWIYFNGSCQGQHTSPQNTQHASPSLESNMCLWFFEIKFRYSERRESEVDHAMSFDTCVIQSSVLICQGQFELNTIFFCYVLTVKCLYSVRGDSTVNWALWKNSLRVSSVDLFPQTLENILRCPFGAGSRQCVGLLKLSARAVWVHIPALPLPCPMTWGKVSLGLCLSFPMEIKIEPTSEGFSVGRRLKGWNHGTCLISTLRVEWWPRTMRWPLSPCR